EEDICVSGCRCRGGETGGVLCKGGRRGRGSLVGERGVEWGGLRPRVYNQYRRMIHQERVLLVTGVVEKQGVVVNVVAERFAAAQ
nr:hypothetical protein [Chloroflexota bacterium]